MAILSSLFGALIETLSVVLNLYVFVVLAGAVLSWLVAFDVVNTRNRLIQAIGDLSFRLTEPALRPIRRFIPAVGGLDLSPLVLIIGIWFVQAFLRNLAAVV